SSDGSKAYVGGPSDGVNSALAYDGDAGTALQFTNRSNAKVSCLAAIGDTLYACMGEPQNTYLQQLGASVDDGMTFAPKFHFSCIPGALECSGCSVFHQCEPSFAVVRLSLGVCPDGGSVAPVDDAGCGADGSVGDAGSDSGPGG